MKAKKKILLSLILLPVLVLLVISGIVFIATAETPEPSISIERFNLTFENNIYIKYAVELTNATSTDSDHFQLLIWTAPQTSYEKGNQDATLSTIGKQTIDGKEYYIFAYKDLAAKQMADDVYARAYYEADGRVYYSDVEKYSMLQYAYNKLGITGTASTNENFKSMLRDMLQYGASAQKYFNYRTDRLANADFRQITVEGGKLPDGSNQGLYIIGEQITMTASAMNAEGISFAYWKDSTGENLGTDLTYTATVGEENEVYTAVYEETLVAPPDEYFAFTLQSDDTYSVAAKDVNNMPAEVVIPASYNGKAVTNIGYKAFYNCTDLTSITIPDSVTSIGMLAFCNCTSLTSITIPEGVTSIGDQAFGYCTGLSSISIPNGVTSIGAYAFQNCTSLASIIIPDSVTSLASGTFSDCTSLASVIISDHVTSISYGMFTNCKNLTAITIPKSVTSIGKDAFWGCHALVSITIPSSVTSISGTAFKSCINLVSITVDSANPVYRSDGNCLIETSSKTLVAGCKNSVIPTGGSVTSIGSFAFYGCSELINITIPDGVTEIGNSAFYGCSGLTSITIPNGVTSIGNSAFELCYSLTNIVIPNSVKNIASSAIRDCSALTDIYYNGTRAEWKAIKKENYWAPNVICIIHCSDGTMGVTYI